MTEYIQKQNRGIMDAFPKTIELNVPDNSLVLTEGRFEQGEWLGQCEYDISGINLLVSVTLRAIPVIDGELYHTEFAGIRYELSHDSEVGGYSVAVYGRITDGNTQTSEWLRNPRRTFWVREFGNQGAVSLDGAKAIAEANIREVYQEFMDYVNSERNYVTQSNGRGHARTTINTNEWNYNFGDTYEDMNYLEWQESEHGYPYEASTKKSKSVPQFSTVVAKLRKKE